MDKGERALAVEQATQRVLQAWETEFRREGRSVPHRDDAAWRARMQPLAERWAESALEGDVVPGSVTMREFEQALVVCASQLAASGERGLVCAAAMRALENAIAGHHAYFRWVDAVFFDAYAVAQRAALVERARQDWERALPIVQLIEGLPCGFLAGPIDEFVAESVLSRLALLVARTGAAAVIVDVAGLLDESLSSVLSAMLRFVGHPSLMRAECFVAALPDTARESWRIALTGGAAVRFVDRFDSAAAAALRSAGYRMEKL